MEKYKIPSLILMERAAVAVVTELMNGAYDLHKVLVACGSGNNGGDGLAVARLLRMKKINVEVCMTGTLDKLTPDAKQQLEMYQAISGKFVTAPAYDEYTVMVDAILGIGCNRDITGIAKEVIMAMNEVDVPKVAIDIPTGISSDNGRICGCAVNAQTTVTFFSEKLGMMLYPGREYCGRIIVEDLGTPFDDPEECRIITYTEEDLERLPARKKNAHKGTFGKVLVIAGSPTISGAAYLAAAGAYHIGAGLVKIFTPHENLAAMQTLLPEALIETYDSNMPNVKQLKHSMEWADVIVLGPGIGTDRMAEKIMRFVIHKSQIPVVVDADGINLLAKNKSSLLDSSVPIVLTPHILEMARLTGVEKDVILKNPMGAARSFTEDYPVTLVLKDARTIVAKENELLYINTSGNSGMATGGSGDVLAGMIGGLIAQKMDVLQAARLGVYLHGKAGDAAAAAKSAYSMTATDILGGISEVTRV